MQKNNSESPRVLQVVSSLGMGGAETWLVQLLRYWRSIEGNCLNVDFLMTSGEESVFDDEVRALGARTFYIALKKGKTISFAAKFRKLLKVNKYSAIHDHQDFLSGWHFLFGVGYLPPVRIAHVHNPSYQLLENYGVTTVRRAKQRIGKSLVAYLATHIGGTSKQVLGEYGISSQTFSRQWVGSLHCAFRVSDWHGSHNIARAEILDELGLPPNCKIVLFAGRLDSSLDINHSQNHKNSALALNIFDACQEQSDVHMLMAGANKYIKDEFQALIDSKKLTDRVHLLGIRRDIARLMLAADVLLFPSRAEGLGMVAVEAQAAGLPVLASTAVPKECVVLDELVRFCDLDQPVEMWGENLKHLILQQRESSTELDPRWTTSDFNIEVCATTLQSIYTARGQ